MKSGFSAGAGLCIRRLGERICFNFSFRRLRTVVTTRFESNAVV
jgi:hypothetical protein